MKTVPTDCSECPVCLEELHVGNEGQLTLHGELLSKLIHMVCQTVTLALGGLHLCQHPLNLHSAHFQDLMLSRQHLLQNEGIGLLGVSHGRHNNTHSRGLVMDPTPS